jgi:thymidylate synthase ThyX
MISAKVIAHSKSEAGKEIISLQLRYPKFIHGEFLTHRVFSRNSSSSRAIPFEKFLKDIEEDMAMPVHWGKNQPGMQAKEELDPVISRLVAKQVWIGYATS